MLEGEDRYTDEEWEYYKSLETRKALEDQDFEELLRLAKKRQKEGRDQK